MFLHIFLICDIIISKGIQMDNRVDIKENYIFNIDKELLEILLKSYIKNIISLTKK